MARTSITYSEFIQKVRRYRPVDLLEAVAAFNCGVSEPEHGSRVWLEASPWGLAKIAKEAILSGSRHFREPKEITVQEILDLHRFFANTSDRDSNLDEESIGRQILLQHSYEQFVYGSYDHDAWARSLAVLHFTPIRHPEIKFDSGFIFNLFGMPIAEAVNGLWLMGQVCRLNRGIWMDDILSANGMDEILRFTSEATLIALRKQISLDIEGYKLLAEMSGESRTSPYRRWDENPLVAYPLVDLEDGRFVAPQYRLVSKLASPNALAYRGLGKIGADFTSQIGPIFQEYVGDQLRLMRGTQIGGEFKYSVGRQEYDSIDWFVKLPGLTLLIEVKAARPNLSVRSGREDVKEAYVPALAKAYKQIATTFGHIQAKHPAFIDFADADNFIGVVVTLEPFYLANSGLFSDARNEYGLPILYASAAELEELVLMEPETLSECLKKIANDPELSKQDLVNSARDYFTDIQNPLIAQAKSSIEIMGATSTR